MADDAANNVVDMNENGAPNQQPRFALKGQYIKDVSLENPNAPMSLLVSKTPPKVDLNIDLQAQKIQENLYELSMIVTVKAESDKMLFVVELNYAGLFEMYNLPQHLVETALLVDAAFMLFPYVRRVVSDLTRDAGYPPLMLEPVDFMGLYQRRLQQQQDAQQGEAN
jgi:preprotein translocase subunit SecB